jgi:hypothetical protein
MKILSALMAAVVFTSGVCADQEALSNATPDRNYVVLAPHTTGELKNLNREFAADLQNQTLSTQYGVTNTYGEAAHDVVTVGLNQTTLDALNTNPDILDLPVTASPAATPATTPTASAAQSLAQKEKALSATSVASSDNTPVQNITSGNGNLGFVIGFLLLAGAAVTGILTGFSIAHNGWTTFDIVKIAIMGAFLGAGIAVWHKVFTTKYGTPVTPTPIGSN